MVSHIKCPKCGIFLDVDLPGQHSLVKCESCGIQFDFFHIAKENDFRKGAAPEFVMADGEASCFFHSDKKAVAVCSCCGAFICGLCEIRTEGESYCPRCFDSSLDKMSLFSRECFRYDQLLLMISVVGLLTCYLGIIFAPFVIASCIFFWNKTKTPYPSGKWRMIMALVISSLQLIFAIGVLISIVFK